MEKKFALVVFLLMFQVAFGELKIGFYNGTCPGAESIILGVVRSAFNSDKSITPALLRMFFHDCFNAACDASILIDPTREKSSEKDADANETVRGYELIDKAKEALEAECPGKVSCADIIAVATRDAVALAGGLNYTVPTGRLDGLVSDPNNVDLPGPSIPVSVALQKFQANNLDENDMVALLGGHTVGITHCSFFQNQLSSPDVSRDSNLVEQLQKNCSSSNGDRPANLDQQTPSRFDNEYYRQIKIGRGILDIDRTLASDRLTRDIVTDFALNSVKFQPIFANAMVKLGNLVAINGEIRDNCRKFNDPLAPQPQKKPENPNRNRQPRRNEAKMQKQRPLIIL